MSGVRVPTFAGITAGAGTSTLAAALHGHDAGTCRTGSGGPWVPEAGIDIVVCRGTPESLARAAEAVAVRVPPVLAVISAGPVGEHDPVQPWLDALRRRYAAVVVLPHVTGSGAQAVLSRPATLLGAAVRPQGTEAFVEALLALTAAVMGSGRLDRAADTSSRRAQPPVATGRGSAAPTPVRLGAPRPLPDASPVAPDQTAPGPAATSPSRRPTVGPPAPAVSAPAGSTPGGSTPGGSTPGESTPGESTPGESTPDESTFDGSTSGGSTPGGSAPDGCAPGERQAAGQGLTSVSPATDDVCARSRDGGRGRGLWRGLRVVESRPGTRPHGVRASRWDDLDDEQLEDDPRGALAGRER